MNLKTICSLTQEELKTRLVKSLYAEGYNPVVMDGFIYAEGSMPIMLVAHMDTVHKETAIDICISDSGVWMSPQGIGGDDRCGIYIILQLIKTLKCHVLFTEDEEVGCVGAEKFAKSNIKPEVNFIIEFDRRGADDAVFYDCDNKEFCQFVETYGFIENYGSCSDISEVAPALGVAAVNLSSGYYNAHTKCEYIDITDVTRTINRARNLICDGANGDKFIYVKSERSIIPYGTSAWETADGYGLNVCVSPLYDHLHYLVCEDGEFYSDDLEDNFFIDQTHEVYEWSDTLGVLVERPDMTAFCISGLPAKLDEDDCVVLYAIPQELYGEYILDFEDLEDEDDYIKSPMDGIAAI